MERKIQIGEFLEVGVTHHPPVGCRKLHKHFIAKNIQRSEVNTKKGQKERQTHTQMRKDIFSCLLPRKEFVLLCIRASTSTNRDKFVTSDVNF